VIELKDIQKTYRTGKNAYQALRGVNLEIRQGELLAILGTSGSGKTTLLNIIGTLDTFDSGSYQWEGQELCRLTDAQRSAFCNQHIGIVLQDYALLAHRSVLFNVCLPMYFNKTPYGEMKKRAREELIRVGLKDQMEKRVSELSGGQKQRVAIARALVDQPQLLLADEPTGALDSKTTGEIMEVFQSLHEQGKTIVLVTHDREVANACERIVRMEDGRLNACQA
jgi:putative ABC transport system ATP-binding protein